ncbi:hypothetical protein KR026_007964 [Drosophila bipectinata]|nr:hypothetical protein KR026_007964 [Drosophila bipectinata]
MIQQNFKLLILFSFCFNLYHLQPVEFAAENGLLVEDDLDWSRANWHLVIPWLLQRQQLRLCVAVARFDERLVPGTACEELLSDGFLMANCDIGNIEDITMTMRGAFGGTLLDTFRKCRPGLELFGIRCRRRA